VFTNYLSVNNQKFFLNSEKNFSKFCPNQINKGSNMKCIGLYKFEIHKCNSPVLAIFLFKIAVLNYLLNGWSYFGVSVVGGHYRQHHCASKTVT
jgi:hypothetical protein